MKKQTNLKTCLAILILMSVMFPAMMLVMNGVMLLIVFSRGDGWHTGTDESFSLITGGIEPYGQKE